MSKMMNAAKLNNAIMHGDVAYGNHRRDYRKLPKAKDARLVPHGNRGKWSEGSYKMSRWDIEVDVVVDGKVVTHSWASWVVAAGMKCSTGLFTSLEKAKEMKKEILAKWGKVQEEAERKGDRKIERGLSLAQIAKVFGTTEDEVRKLFS